jgi:hypothetical protein
MVGRFVLFCTFCLSEMVKMNEFMNFRFSVPVVSIGLTSSSDTFLCRSSVSPVLLSFK